MKKSWNKSISLSLACLLGFGVLAATFAINNKQSNPVKVDAATTTTATLTYSDVLANARGDYKKTTWGNWEWWKVTKKNGELYAGHNTYFVNTTAYTNGATKIDFSISFKDGYVIPKITMIAEILAKNSNSFSWTITDTYYNENPPKRIYFEDSTSGETHIIDTLTVTYTFTKYKITLNSNGGTGGLSSVQNPYNRDMPTIASSNLPTREGYTFQGYYDTSAATGGNQYYKANGTSARKFTNKDDSLVLYARWALALKPVNITKGTGLSNVYVSSNGNVTDASSSDLKASGTNFAQGSTVYGYVKLAAGYKAQSEWTLKAGTADTAGALYLVGSGSVSSSGYDFGTLNASTITYSIDYELNGGSVATANPTSYTIESDTFTLNNPTKEGYKFLGWSEDGKSGYTETVTIAKGTYGNKKYTANWALVDELQAVVDAINNLDGPSNISYPGSKTGLENAESLYSALSSDLKAVLNSDYPDLVNELIEDRNQYDSLRSASIDNAINKIDAISEPISYPGSRDEVFAARDALAGLDESDRVDTVVTNLSDYNNALNTYNTLRDLAVTQVIESIDNISRDGEGKILYPNSKSSLEIAEFLFDALAEEEKTPTVVTNYNDLLQARSDYNALREDRVQDVIDAIDAISKPFDESREEHIANAQQLFDGLDNSDKNATVITNLNKLEDAHAADYVADAIEALPVVSDTNEFRASVSQARESYKNLTDDQKGFIPSNILTLLVGREKALEVIDSIKDIGDVNYPSSKEKIDTANALYAAYIEAGYPAEFIVNYQTLVDANTLYDDVDAVAALIKAIPAANESDEYYNAVDLAKAEFDKLSSQGQTLLTNATFDESGITYAQHLADQVAAREVIELIQTIGEVTYNGGENDSSVAIIVAKAGYQLLTDDQKAIVNGVNYDDLTHKDTVYGHVNDVALLIEAIPEAGESQEYYAAVDAAKTAYNDLTPEEQAILGKAPNFDYVKKLNDNVAARAVIEEIANIGTVTYDGGVNDSLAKIVSAETNYGNLSDDQKDIVNSTNYSTLTDDREVYDNVSAEATLIKAIPAAAESEEYYNAVDTAIAEFNLLSEEEQNVLKASIFDPETGITYYQYLFNHVAAREVIELIQNIGEVTYNGGENDSSAAIIAAKVGYALLTDDQKAIVNGVNYDDLTHKDTVYGHVNDVALLIEAIPEPSDTPEYYEAVQKAYDAFFALTDEEEAILNASTRMDYHKTLFDNLNAMWVIKEIQAIGDVTYNKGDGDSLEAIESAETNYSNLTEDQKALVDAANKSDLDYDRSVYDHVDETVDLINAIGEVSHTEDKDSKEALDAARTAYDALNEEEKALVRGYNDSYQTLEDDEAVYEVMVKIDAIGEVSYDTRSEDAINEAREVYNSLTKEQQDQLGDAYSNTLTTAETKYSELKKTADIWVIVLLTIASLLVIGAIWLLIVLLRKKKNNNDDQNGNSGSLKKEPVKAMSIGGILPLAILTSNYLSGPWIALYAVAGVAVLLWISILAIVIMKKKQVGPFKKKAEVAKAEPQATTTQNEDEEVETISDEKGNIFQIRYIKSFTAKLIQSPEETKKYYEELKNEVLSYKKTNSRISWHFDSVNAGRNYILKFAIRGKTLCVYLPLNADDYADSKYKVEKVESKKYEDVPCLYRIKNDRRLGYAKELIAVVASNLGLEKGEEQHEVYSNLPYEPNKPLIERGLIKELKAQVNKPVETIVETKEDEEGNEVVVSEDNLGNKYETRYLKSFTAKLSQASDEVKDYYNELKNHALSFKGTLSRMSWNYDTISVNNKGVLKFVIKRKNLYLYYALDTSKIGQKYKVEHVEYKKYEDVPTMLMVDSDKRKELSKELIDRLMRQNKCELGKNLNDEYRIPFESKEVLIKKGLIKEVKVKI